MPASSSQSTVNRNQRLNVLRNVFRYRSFKHLANTRRLIEAAYIELETEQKILRGFYDYLRQQSVDGSSVYTDSNDDTQLWADHNRTPRPFSSAHRARLPIRYLELPSYDPDGYSSDPETSSRGHKLTSRITNQRRTWTPPGHIYNRDSASVTAVFHLDQRLEGPEHVFRGSEF